jgi:hypothetical protein
VLDLGGVAGVKLARVFLHEARHGGEVIAWVTRPTAVSSPA